MEKGGRGVAGGGGQVVRPPRVKQSTGRQNGQFKWNNVFSTLNKYQIVEPNQQNQ
jgi:hypothetical protein